MHNIKVMGLMSDLERLNNQKLLIWSERQCVRQKVLSLYQKHSAGFHRLEVEAGPFIEVLVDKRNWTLFVTIQAVRRMTCLIVQ